MGSKSWLLMLALLAAAGLVVWLSVLAPTTAPHGPDPLPQALVPSSVLTEREPGMAASGSPSPAPPLVREEAAIDGAAPTVVYRGIVEEWDGRGIAAATVELFAGVPTGQPPLAVVQTDAGGRFVVAVAGPVEKPVLQASAADHLSATDRHPVAAHLNRLRLPGVLVVSGRVVARASGAAVVGATVSDGTTRVECDAAGSYEIRAAKRMGVAQVWAEAPGFVDRHEALVLHEQDRIRLDFDLMPTEPLTVQIVDRETRSPIVGAALRPHELGEVLGRTDADGRFVLDGGEGRSVHLRIDADGFCPLEWTWVVAAGAVPVPQLPLTRAARVEGTVTVATERAVHARVTVEPVGRLDSPMVRQWSRDELEAAHVPGDLRDAPMPSATVSDEAGHYVVLVRPSPAPLRAKATSDVTSDGWASGESGELVLAQPGEVARVDLMLVQVPTGTIRGVVRRNGTPSAGRLYWSQGERRGHARANTAGAFAMRMVPPGTVEISLRADNGNRIVATASVQVTAGQASEQDFAWEEGEASISGRVTLTNGEPVQARAVQVVERGGGEGCRIYRAITDASGSYQVLVAADTSYRVSVSGPCLRSVDGVLPGSTGVDLVLPETGSLRLRLIDAASGQPVRYRGDGLWTVSWRESGAGAFQVAGATLDDTGLLPLQVPLGTVDVCIDLQDAGYVRCLRNGIAVSKSEHPAEVRIEVEPGVDVRLAVRGATPFTPAVGKGHVLFLLEDGQADLVRGPFADQGGESNARINGVNVWIASQGLIHQMPRLDASARATVRGLAPGRYRLAAFPDDLVFEPSTFEVGPAGADVELGWRRR